MDANGQVLQVDAIRCFALYNGLMRLSPDARQIVHDLAEELTPSKDARTWTVRLKPDLKFSDGRPVTADDVIFTYRRITNPRHPFSGAPALGPLERNSMRKLDKRTVEMPMSVPYASFPEQICQMQYLGIIPSDYNPKAPVGTGPFKYQSFTPGQQSVFVRNEHYLGAPQPYLDTLTIITSFADETAAFNALQGGQIDAFAQAPQTLINQAKGSSTINALVSLPGQWTPFTMRVDKSPFDDVRVRQAMRLIANRPQLISDSLTGLGSVGNDVFSQWDPAYDSSLHRGQDLPQAKSLLKQAGREGLAVTLVTSDFAPGVVQAAQVFAQQANGAGMTIKINHVPSSTFYGPSYLQWPFAQDYWGYTPFLNQVALGSLKASPFNETHWNNPRYVKLYGQANASLDPSRRKEIEREMQLIDFNDGGLIIYAYNKLLDLLAANVRGIGPAGTGLPLGACEWQNIWLA
ncbi:MAG: ABC transporter substrate-binding protein [Solirubrobacteraceae bacterium]